MTDNLKLFERSTFICGSCGAVFSATRDEHRVDEATEQLFAPCPACPNDAPEAWWMANLRQGHGKQTGPITVEGKLRSSRNGVKHGTYSASHLYPRSPDKYPECDGCQDIDECRGDVSGYCHRKMEIHHKFMLAISRGDPEAIKDIAAKNFAAVQQLITHLFHDIFRNGATLESPVYVKLRDMDGAETVEFVKDSNDQPLIEFKAHPGIKYITEMLKGIGFTLPEFSATPKGKTDAEILKGHLDAQETDRQTTTDYLNARTQAANNLTEILEDARKLRENDPTTARIIADHKNEAKELPDGSGG